MCSVLDEFVGRGKYKITLWQEVTLGDYLIETMVVLSNLDRIG